MKSKRIQALVLASAVAVGYGGAAAWTAMATPSLPVVSDWGDGDGLTRYVVSASTGTVTADLLAGLQDVDGVVSAQPLSDGRALVAADGLAPQHLTAVPGVAAAEFDTTVEVAGALTDPFVPQYGWHLDNTGRNAYQQAQVTPDADTDAPDGWDTTTGEGMVVAVIDTGYDSDHPDMAGALWTNPAQPCGTADTDGNGKPGDCHGWNWYAGSADIDNGGYGEHGASVSGTVGARANNGQGLAGVAPGVQIMPLVIGGGRNVSVTAGAEAIRYAVDHGADAINASWGGAFSGPALDVLRSAVAYAAAHDVLFVTAAGNDSGNRDTSPVYPASLTEWNVITVGSSTAADTVSDVSGYGATSVDLFAPGTLIASITNTGGYGLSSGTSLASPMVAAAVALYKAAKPTATAAELRAALLADVDPVPALAGKSVTGGRLTLGHLTSDPSQTVQYAFSAMTARAGTASPVVGTHRRGGHGRLLRRARPRHGVRGRDLGPRRQAGDPRRDDAAHRRLRDRRLRPRHARRPGRHRPVAVDAPGRRPLRAHRPAVPRRPAGGAHARGAAPRGLRGPDAGLVRRHQPRRHQPRRDGAGRHRPRWQHPREHRPGRHEPRRQHPWRDDARRQHPWRDDARRHDARRHGTGRDGTGRHLPRWHHPGDDGAQHSGDADRAGRHRARGHRAQHAGRHRAQHAGDHRPQHPRDHRTRDAGHRRRHARTDRSGQRHHHVPLGGRVPDHVAEPEHRRRRRRHAGDDHRDGAARGGQGPRRHQRRGHGGQRQQHAGRLPGARPRGRRLRRDRVRSGRAVDGAEQRPDLRRRQRLTGRDRAGWHHARWHHARWDGSRRGDPRRLRTGRDLSRWQHAGRDHPRWRLRGRTGRPGGAHRPLGRAAGAIGAVRRAGLHLVAELHVVLHGASDLTPLRRR
nr:S8 family serine peptidase [Blastococcus sp. TF02A-30]